MLIGVEAPLASNNYAAATVKTRMFYARKKLGEWLKAAAELFEASGTSTPISIYL